MSPPAKIIVALLLSTVAFLGLFAVCAGTALSLSLNHANWLGGPGRPYTSSENLVFFLCLVGAIAALAIHPLGAYLTRYSVYKLTGSQQIRALVFVGFSCFPLILVFLLYTLNSVNSNVSFRIEEHERVVRQRRFEADVMTPLRAAGVEVDVLNARIIESRNQNGMVDANENRRDTGELELTLQVKNVPSIVPRYILAIELLDDINISFYGGELEATNENGRWIFRDNMTREIISNNPDAVTFIIGFPRNEANTNYFPKSITPRLSLRATDYAITGYYPVENSTFYNQKVEIESRNL